MDAIQKIREQHIIDVIEASNLDDESASKLSSMQVPGVNLSP
jgi:hypothetical protein